MSDKQQQDLKEYSYQVVKLPDTAPPISYNQETMLRNCAVSSTYQNLLVSSNHSQWSFQIHPVPEMSQEACQTTYHVRHAPYYGPIALVSLFT